MTKELLKMRVARRKAWMGNEETMKARNKLVAGELLTVTESRLLFEYIRRLEVSLDTIIESSM